MTEVEGLGDSWRKSGQETVGQCLHGFPSLSYVGYLSPFSSTSTFVCIIVIVGLLLNLKGIKIAEIRTNFIGKHQPHNIILFSLKIPKYIKRK